ncbi:MAG: DUF4214 domain-containing protein [Thermodesulfobacteriota bacterium]
MALTQSQISQLYVVIFNRASEGEGNRYWQQTQSDPASAVTAMLETQDAREYFGSSLNANQAFIEHIYLNALNKTIAQDPDGIAFWTGLLDSGVSRGSVVAQLVGAIENYAPGGPGYDPNDGATVAAYHQFVNRVEVSNYMADHVEYPPADYPVSTAFDQNLPVTDDPATVAAAKFSVDQLAGGFSRTDVSIDIGTLAVPAFFDAGAGGFNFVDDATVFTHVVIQNFSADDGISFQNASAANYTFSNYTFSNNGEDVFIIFNNQGIVNQIVLTGVVNTDVLVYDQTSLETAIGFDPILYA